MAQNPFEIAQASHARVVSEQPIDRRALLDSLKLLRDTGGKLVQEQEMGAIRYANTMHGILSTAVELETVPPMSHGHKSVLMDEISGLEAITQGNSDGGVAEEPTNTDAIDTGKIKS